MIHKQHSCRISKWHSFQYTVSALVYQVLLKMLSVHLKEPQGLIFHIRHVPLCYISVSLTA